jgi:SAM-dependent methyltransferase
MKSFCAAMLENPYDTIGHTYTTTRRPDPRIAESINRALRDATTIVNVGAGTGAYEPADQGVVAVEPSWRMIRQRAPGTAPVVRAVAEALPFGALTFDVALAALTVHHWTDWRQGIAEMTRVAKRVVVFAFDVNALDHFWLTTTYFPGIIDLDRKRSPSIAEIEAALGNCSVEPVPIPHDCVDGFLAAFWRRPETYLDPRVRAGMSGFAQSDQRSVDQGLKRLEADLKSRAWEHRFGELRSLDTFDAGYRLLSAEGQARSQRREEPGLAPSDRR